MNRRTSGAGRRAFREILRFSAILLLAGCRPPRADAAFPNALWMVVHDMCGADMKLTGHPAPCALVDKIHDYAVLKDPRSYQILVMPTRRLSGIESPELLAPNTPNYWQYAWATKPMFEQRAHRPVPHNALGMAINSISGRTQDQLHIHVDCVRPEVQQALAANLDKIGPKWADLDVTLKGRRFRAMRIAGSDLDQRDPFKLLAEGDPIAAADMGPETMAVIGVNLPDGTPGFVLLARRANLAIDDKGASEGLLDHRCSLLSEEPS